MDAPPAARILLVEDDARIAEPLVRALRSQGYDVRSAPDGTTARELVTTFAPQLVLLDLGLPDVDGIDLCRELVDRLPRLRVLMLTARAEEIDIVVGLDAGAVDYLPKPFRLAELLARVRAQVRFGATSLDERPVRSRGLIVERDARRAWVDGVELDLRAKEFDLLAELAGHEGHVVRREDLMTRVWDEHWFGSTKTLDVHVAALRRKLREAAPGRRAVRIDTLRGVGYRLEQLD